MWKFLLGAVLLFCAMGNLYWTLQGGIDADLLHLPMMFRDWQAGHLDWFFYSLPPARYIFPDIPLFFALNMLMGNGVQAMCLNIALNLLLVWGLLAWALQIYFQVPFKKSLLPILLALVVFMVPGVFPVGAVKGLFFPTFHAGVLCCSLLGYCVLGYWLQRPGWVRAAWVFAVAVLTGLSDPLGFAIFIVPAMVLAVVAWQPKRFWWRLVLPVILFAGYYMGGCIGDYAMPYAPLQFLHKELPPVHFIGDSFLVFFHWILSWEGLPFVILMLGAFCSLWMLWKRLPEKRGVLIGLGALVVLPIGVALVMGRFTDVGETRYFALSLLAATLLSGYVIKNAGPRIIVVGVVVCGVGLTLLSAPEWPTWARLNYPMLVGQMDTLKKPLGLKAGLAEYWDAKSISYFSKEHLVVNCLSFNGRLHCKLESIAWLGVPFTPGLHLEYNFILTRHMSKKSVAHIYGKPSKTYDIILAGEPTQLWLYDHDLNQKVAEDHLLWELVAARLMENSYMISPLEHEIIATRLAEVIVPAIERDPSDIPGWLKLMMSAKTPLK